MNGGCGATNGSRPAATASMLAPRGWTSHWECSWAWRSRPRWPRAGGSCARRACRTRRARRCRAPCTPPRRCCRTCAAGSSAGSAPPAAPHLRTLTGASAVALADTERLLAFDGAGADHHRPAIRWRRSPARSATTACASSRGCTASTPGCPLRSAIVAPLVVQDRRVGALVALYDRPGRLRLEETRVVGEAAALVSAMVELSEMEAQGERLARAELRALRAQISPHFIYNALAAVASFIHSRPEEARELLTEFAEFIRYAFARQRAYVTVADELRYVEKYLRLEQARFGERLKVRVQVDPEVLQAVLPGAVAAAAGGERGAPRGRAPARGRAGGDRGDRPRQRRRAAGVRRRRRHRPRARRAMRSRAGARASGSATCTGGCCRRSARATGSGRVRGGRAPRS